MNFKQAIAFLENNQPLKAHPDPESISKYLEVVDFFTENPSPACLPLFITSFGHWGDLQPYDAVSNVFSKFSTEITAPYILAGLIHASPHIRFWSADLAVHRPHPELVDGLLNMLLDPLPALRLIAARALENHQGPQISVKAKALLPKEQDEFVRESLEILAYRS